jgi:hypothetical protein
MNIRFIPDKYLAVGLFVLLLGVYLATKDPFIEKLCFGAFTLVCTAIGDGLKRVGQAFEGKWKNATAEKTKETQPRSDQSSGS